MKKPEHKINKILRDHMQIVAMLDDSWDNFELISNFNIERSTMRKANTGDALVSPEKQKKERQ
jgi:hypothetical protein